MSPPPAAVLEALARAIAAVDHAQLRALLAPDVRWVQVGRKPVVGVDAVLKVLDRYGAADALELRHVVADGTTGAVDGVAQLGGKSRGFCHVAELDHGRVRAFTTWLVVEAAGQSPEGAMTEDTFWQLIAETGGAYKPLVTRLADLPVDAIVAFDDHLGRLLHRSYGGDLWCVAYVAMSGCSDDSFDYFRGWLVTRGKAVFEAALRDPDSLFDPLVALKEHEGDIPLNEDILAAAAKAYAKKTRRADFYDLPRVALPPRPKVEFRWDEDDEQSMRTLCPRVFDRFWSDPF
jgi:hypothetical protein